MADNMCMELLIINFIMSEGAKSKGHDSHGHEKNHEAASNIPETSDNHLDFSHKHPIFEVEI